MLIYYHEKRWQNGDPLVKAKKRQDIDPQPDKPPLRPGHWVEFTDPYFKDNDFETCVGKIKHVVLDTETGIYTYCIHLAWSRFDCKIEQIKCRMIRDAVP